MKFPLCNIFLLAGLLGLNSCLLSKGKEKPKEPIIKLLISFREGPCRGKCSRFEAEFYTGQKMIFNGISRMPVSGNYRYLVPEKMPVNLLAEAESLKLSAFPDSLPSSDGEQRFQLQFLTSGGRYKKISAGMQSAPAAIQSFLKLLHSEVRIMVEDQEGEKLP